MILSALNSYYERLASDEDSGIAPAGYSAEKIAYAVVLDTDGQVVAVDDLRDTTGARPLPRKLIVPASSKRPGQIFKPFLFWDKTSYALGLSGTVEKLRKKQESGEELSDREKDTLDKKQKRLPLEHQEFRSYHIKLLENSTDEGLSAFVHFLNKWDPNAFSESEHFRGLGEDFLDSNVVFQLDGEQRFMHERPAAKEFVPQDGDQSGESERGMCLVTGEYRTIARIHESIKDVAGAQSSGASIVSFNKGSFESYGKSQGYNAPVSKRAAASYVTALNFLLRRDEGNRQRLQIGDATVVFWAEAANVKQAEAGENLLSNMLNPVTTDETETIRLQSALAKISKGRPFSELGPELDEETRIYVLGLAPNASRLSIRFWEANSLKNFTRRLAQHYQDLCLDPLPWKNEPAVWRLIGELAPHREGSKPRLADVPPQLAGDLTRAILTGQRYPQSLLTNVLMRIRADGHISPLRVALCKAVLCRNARFTNTKKEIPVSLDKQNQDPGYLLGRLFASLESCQRNALGKEVNATIRDRYFGAASAAPATIFPVLVRNAQHHLSKVKKDKPGLAVLLERQLGEIIGLLDSEFPRSLGLQAQGRFAIGYYHQQQEAFKNHTTQSGQGAEK